MTNKSAVTVIRTESGSQYVLDEELKIVHRVNRAVPLAFDFHYMTPDDVEDVTKVFRTYDTWRIDPNTQKFLVTFPEGDYVISTPVLSVTTCDFADLDLALGRETVTQGN